ncbi:hypothetical protein [Rhizobium wuzhouense]|uniref:Uncharacterized protein n=1 Tax=Rhizobium wuzhouense TaxID=1986026 RepID=A0ABX5NW32_9HYPH|nr:hypothetical protein [Rhizobium wuzhouense]PYB77377.1 hypothetical protein DMY87_03155 [Rhizobium wuzhouense]
MPLPTFSLRPALLAVLLLASSVPSIGIDAAQASEAETDRQIENLLGDPADYKELFYAFQSAVAEGKAEIAVSLVSYPITISIGGEDATFETEEQLLASYNDVFTDKIVTIIRNQDYGQAFVNSEGLMFGDGEVWISGVCEDSACSSSLPRVITIQSVD